jgi:hypothetical protein
MNVYMRAFPKVLAVLAISISAVVSTSSAYAMCDAGYTCFKDWEANKWGQVKDNNRNWGSFGWNDRADRFKNNGRTHNNCLYEHAGYRGRRMLLRRGQWATWRNIVSSNRWTRASRCY